MYKFTLNQFLSAFVHLMASLSAWSDAPFDVLLAQRLLKYVVKRYSLHECELRIKYIVQRSSKIGDPEVHF